MIIRRARSADQAAVHNVHTMAFKPDGAGIAAEATLVDQLSADGDVIARLSLVAELDQAIVGHVVCSRGDIDGRPALGLGPLGVLPEHQRHGVGHALMHAVIAAADALDELCVLLLGHVDYYPRFGFENATLIGVRPPDPAWTDHFQIRRLASWSDTLRGTFHYATAFDRL